MNELESAYIAGIIDSGGSISMAKTRDHRQRGERVRLHVQISDTSASLVPYLCRVAGGRRRKPCPAALRDRPVHRWELSDSEMAPFLEAIFPYLVVKQDQAAIAIRFRNRRGASTFELDENDRIALCRLNAKGTHTRRAPGGGPE